eukprot:923151-Lingulodinium_polyedra.AAC.1
MPGEGSRPAEPASGKRTLQQKEVEEQATRLAEGLAGKDGVSAADLAAIMQSAGAHLNKRTRTG